MAFDRKDMLREVIRLVTLVVAFGSGITVIVTITTLKSKFSGRCIVLSDVVFNGIYFTIPATHSSCKFITYYQGVCCIVSSVWIIYGIVNVAAKRIYIRPLPLFAVCCLIKAVIALISACILITGLRKICNGLTRDTDTTCEAYESASVWAQVTDDGTNFIGLFKSAQVASWVSCICWCVLFATYVVQMRCSAEIRPQRFQNETNVVT